MQILDVPQLKAWDEYTITHEPISSLQLMERAATACFNWLMENGYTKHPFIVFCGKGNNGGDGLVLARLLAESGCIVSVYIIETGKAGTNDFEASLSLLPNKVSNIHYISETNTLPSISEGTVIIDALFGYGLNKPLEGFYAVLVNYINKSGNEIISIDLPSGLFADKSSIHATVIKASHTLSFQCFKLAFAVPENEIYTGRVHILDIGLHLAYLQTISPTNLFITQPMIRSFFRRRKPFAHKGNFGHAALLAGSYGMMGAAVLAAQSCMRSGVGKLTCHIPACGYTIMQLALPEAMCIVEEGEKNSTSFGYAEKYDAVGIGPGLGNASTNSILLAACFATIKKPIVLDADALNTLANDRSLISEIPANTILTPHIKEFDRLFGNSLNDFDRMQKAIQKANALQIIIVLKGRFTLIATPGGITYFNTTGNPGMAKAGNGDVLTGMILAFLAQGYHPEQAACISVYLHGLAADITVSDLSEEALLPTDCIKNIGAAIKQLY